MGQSDTAVYVRKFFRIYHECLQVNALVKGRFILDKKYMPVDDRTKASFRELLFHYLIRIKNLKNLGNCLICHKRI